jgi:eukaryotic-like serine/threonine-protein kinase
MPDRTCRKCGTQFRAETAQGLCPRCLFESGMQLAREWAFAQGADIVRERVVGTGSPQEPRVESAPDSRESVPEWLRGKHQLGDYELIEEVGSGGMGVVYKARQLSLNRTVAVKMMLAGDFANPAALRRFGAEAQLAAGLHHPNIVTVYETGEAEGHLYFSMEYVEGRTLAELARGTPLAPDRAARYMRRIAAATHYAHQNGILHRDLKPSNVLIDQTDTPRITDFGLAKHLDTDSDLTQSGQVVGSPNFMSPEQASSRLGAVGPRADLYGLGAILYCLLTGRPPFHAATVSDTLEQLLLSDPVPPRLLNPSVPVDLETICLKCLEKEPPRRYETAQEVVEELDRFLRGEPIRARPLGPVGRIWRWSRREPVLA